MKRPLFLLLSGIVALTCVAETKVVKPRVSVNPYDVSVLAPSPVQPREKTPLMKLEKKLRPFGAPSSVKTYKGAFQAFHSDYEFYFEGGDFLCYDVEISIDGEIATVSNLFNLEDGYPNDYTVQNDITGRYDAETNTIIIPTAKEFDKATIAGLIYNYYPAVVMSGTVGADESIVPDNELVFHISDDGSTLTTDQNFGVAMYSAEGSAMGFKCMYKGGIMVPEDSDYGMVLFGDSLDFGKAYIGMMSEKSLKLFNLSSSDISYSVTCDNTAYSLEKNDVTTAPYTASDIYVTFSPDGKGDYNGELKFSALPDRKIGLRGEGVPSPDFTVIVKEGDMTLSTEISAPFYLEERDGVTVARSGCELKDNSVSILTAEFEVPEGEIGVFSWKGYSSSEVSYAAIPVITTDEYEKESFEALLNKDISGSRKLGPGKHKVEFSYTIGYAAYATEKDFMYVYDLSLTREKAESSKASLLTPEVTLPNSLLESEPVEKKGEIRLLNEGTEVLKIIEASGDANFSVNAEGLEASFLEEMAVPVVFTANKAGEYSTVITLNTTAGKFDVKCVALVRDMPDFSSIVKEGDFTFTTDENHPFLVKDGKAYNSTSKVPDTEMTMCSFTANFTVPEGMLGRLSWKGNLSCAGIGENNTWSDYLMISHTNGSKFCNVIVAAECDLSTEFYPYVESPDARDLLCLAGDRTLTFTYMQYGDNAYGGEDLVEIYDLSLELVEDQPYNAAIDKEEVEFPTVYEGKRSIAKLLLTNLGTEKLTVEDIDSEGPFYADFPAYEPPFNESVALTLYFTPESAGNHEGTVTIYTTGGDFEIQCKGYAESTAGMLLVEDFEDDAEGWTIFDRDSDGDNWNLAFNVYGGYTWGKCHSGEECLVSFSWDYLSGEFTPDNWTFSPEFTIPEEGAVLTWWVAGDDINRAGDVYSVYVAEGERASSFDLDSYKEVWTETIDFVDWQFRNVDLSEYAGKTVHVAFRHHDSKGFYLVKIDDVFVYSGTVGVNKLSGERTVKAVRYFTPEGVEVASRYAGIVIEQTVYTDGSIEVRKIIG